MRVRRRSEVEEISKKQAPCTVQYDDLEGSKFRIMMERVTQKAIGHCPPPMGASEKWVAGDIVEVFDNFSWKMATVSDVLGEKYYLVRLPGSCHEFKVSKFEIRLGRCWQDDKRIIMEKDADDRKYDEKLNMKYNYNQSSSSKVQKKNKRINVRMKNKSFTNQDKKIEDSLSTNKTLKRGFRVGEKYDHTRLNNSTARISEMDNEKRKRRRKTIVNVCDFPARNLESSYADSDKSSVGSCSISNSNSYSYKLPPTGPGVDINENLSDAESFSNLRCEDGNCHFPTKEELAAEIHKLELHAYRSTMEALYASGPLSWEQEEMVTDLRLSLHISNDEHLMELKHLVSTDSRISTR